MSNWLNMLAPIFLIVSLLGAAYYIKHYIEQGQYNKDQAAQLVQLQRDVQDLRKKQDQLEKKNEEILQNTKVLNDAANTKHETVVTYIKSPEARASDRDSSAVIKKTIGMLRDDQ